MSTSKEEMRSKAIELAMYRERTMFHIAKWSNQALDHGSKELFDNADDILLYIQRGTRP